METELCPHMRPDIFILYNVIKRYRRRVRFDKTSNFKPSNFKRVIVTRNTMSKELATTLKSKSQKFIMVKGQFHCDGIIICNSVTDNFGVFVLLLYSASIPAI